MLAWLWAIIVWPPSTSCGPRSSVPPVTRRTDVQPSFSFCDSSVWVSSSRSTMSLTFTAGVCANARVEQSVEAANSASVLFMSISLRHLLVGRERDARRLAFRVHPHVGDANRGAVGRQHVGEHLRDLAVLLVDDLVDPIGDDPDRAAIGSRMSVQRLLPLS